MRAREFTTESTANTIWYHGGPKPIAKFRTPAYGVYFSPHEEWAEEYGDVITRARVWADPVYRIDYSHDIDDDIIDALFDRDYRTVAKFIKLLQAQGYRSMQSVTDSEMLVVFPGARIEVLPPETVQESTVNPDSAGCILRAADTGRWCLQKRSDHVSDPGIWSCWGGGRNPGETLEQTVRRELAEEGGYRGPITLIPVQTTPQYATFIGLVPREFEPQCNHEVADWQWFDDNQWPSPLHPGMKTLNESKAAGKIRAYHGNQGGIDTNRLVAPMWFTQSLEDAQHYAGDDGHIVVADLDISNPYIIRPGQDEPNTVLHNWRQLQAQGYDGIYDSKVNDWIPFSADQIHVVKVDRWPDLDENFADGRVRGKSRPGRVKRAGASCNGSVSDLRARAKKYGGERGKMYHWCANMKSGKKKK